MLNWPTCTALRRPFVLIRESTAQTPRRMQKRCESFPTWSLTAYRTQQVPSGVTHCIRSPPCTSYTARRATGTPQRGPWRWRRACTHRASTSRPCRRSRAGKGDGGSARAYPERRFPPHAASEGNLGKKTRTWGQGRHKLTLGREDPSALTAEESAEASCGLWSVLPWALGGHRPWSHAAERSLGRAPQRSARRGVGRGMETLTDVGNLGVHGCWAKGLFWAQGDEKGRWDDADGVLEGQKVRSGKARFATFLTMCKRVTSQSP